MNHGNLFPEPEKLDPNEEVKMEDDEETMPKPVAWALFALLFSVVVLLILLVVWGCVEVWAQIQEAL